MIPSLVRVVLVACMATSGLASALHGLSGGLSVLGEATRHGLVGGAGGFAAIAASELLGGREWWRHALAEAVRGCLGGALGGALLGLLHGLGTVLS